jgi:hypothetical protein
MVVIEREDVMDYRSKDFEGLEPQVWRLEPVMFEWGGGVANGGGEEYRVNGRLHRFDGPAIQWDGGVVNGGGEAFFCYGIFHREDGPAIIGAAMTETLGPLFFLCGQHYGSEAEHAGAVARWNAAGRPAPSAVRDGLASF